MKNLEKMTWSITKNVKVTKEFSLEIQNIKVLGLLPITEKRVVCRQVFHRFLDLHGNLGNVRKERLEKRLSPMKRSA